MLLHRDITGQGPTLVLIHGLFGAADNLGGIARALADKFQIINLDLRNHGRSAHTATMDYSSMAQDVLDTLDALAINQFALLGHSMGGKVAMQVAFIAPARVSKLILADIAPVATPPSHQHILKGLSQIPLAELPNRQAADPILAEYVPELAVRQFLLKNLQNSSEGLMWRFNLTALQKNYQAILAAPPGPGPYTGPALFIKGGLSDYITAEHKPIISRLFPNTSLKIIEGTGHWLHAEKPAAFAKIVSDFLLN